MDVFEIVYIAVGTVLVLVILHLTTFWVARVIQPPKPKIVYVQSPPAPVAAPMAAPVAPPVAPLVAPVAPVAPPPAILSEKPTNIQLPTYDVPATSTPSAELSKMGSLPPPIETRSTTKQSGGDLGPPR